MLQLTIEVKCLLDASRPGERGQPLPPLEQDLLRVVDTSSNVVYVFEFDAPDELFAWLRDRSRGHVAIAEEDEFS